MIPIQARFHIVSALAFVLLWAVPAAPAQETINALFISGGGYHDYDKTTPYLAEQIGKQIPIQWTVKYGLDAFQDESFGDGFDVIIYDCCFPAESDPKGVENALRATREGTPTVIVHCATVCFLYLPEWQKLVGHTIKGHDKYRAMQTVKADPEHPIMKRFPDNWKTEGDELYRISVPGGNSHALLQAKSPEDDKEHAVAWTHQYGQGRVFATSLGHDLKTIEDKDYHALLANGILWTLGRLDAETSR
jgi:type 1 glutamine amidotransferase